MDCVWQALDMFGRLDNIICSSAFDCFGGNLLGAGTGYDDDWQVRAGRANRFENLQTFEAQDIEVAQDKIKTAVSECRFKICPPNRLRNFKTLMLLFERVPYQCTVKRVIIYIKDTNRLVHI